MKIDESLDFVGLKDLVKGCVGKIFNELNIRSDAWFQTQALLHDATDRYSEYVLRSVGMFPLFGTSKVTSVDSSYVRVDVTQDIEREKYRHTDEVARSLQKQKLGETREVDLAITASTPIAAIETTNNGFALIGNAGSGKTTAFRFLAVQAARGAELRSARRLPIYLPVRDLARSHDGIAVAAQRILMRFGVRQPEIAWKLLLESGNCVILLDGVDETSTDHRSALIAELIDLYSMHSKPIFCLSSRPLSLEVGLNGFTKWEVVPLRIEDRIHFVRKWFLTVDQAKGEQLIERCALRPELLDLGSSPLLLSIVCALYYNDLDIPSNPVELYARAVKGLLGEWDIFRNVARNSPLADFSIHQRTVLAGWIAFMLFEAQKIAFSVRDVEQTGALSKVAEMMRKKLPPTDDLLKSLYNDFGLLIDRAPGIFSFTHLTLHEYLVARHLADHRSEIDVLARHRRDRNWHEVIKMVVMMLPQADQFLNVLQRETPLGSIVEMTLLESVWLSNPICTLPTRRRLMIDLATKAAHFGKIVGSSFLVKNGTLYIRDEAKRGKRIRYMIHDVEYLEKSKSKIEGRRQAEGQREFVDLTLQASEGDSRAASKLKRRTREERASSRSPWSVTENCLPLLLRILNSAEFTIEELGVGENKLFRALNDAGSLNITQVKFLGNDEQRSL